MRVNDDYLVVNIFEESVTLVNKNIYLFNFLLYINIYFIRNTKMNNKLQIYILLGICEY